MCVCVNTHPCINTSRSFNIGNYRRRALLRCMDGGANPLMDRKVVGFVLFGVVAVVTSLTTAGCSQKDIKEHRMAHTHPRAKTTYMTDPKCLNVIHHNISLYILFHAILSYLNLTNPHKHICCEKKATHGRHTSKHRSNIHNLSNMSYYDAPQCAFPQGRRSSATT